MSNSTELRALFGDYAGGRISAEQLEVLEAALAGDADLRREFIEYMNLDSALGDIAALPESEGVPLAPDCADTMTPAKSVPARSRTARAAWAVGTVAATLLLGLVVCISVPGTDQGTPAARLVTQVDGALLRSGEPWDDAVLPAGEYRLDDGLAQLQFVDGASVYVEAPAQFEIISKQRLKLLSGRISANVPPAGIGFTVETAEARVVDFGTEFSVEAGSGASEVHVFSGLVRVQPRNLEREEGDAIDLRTAEAVRIEDSPQSPVAITLATERFIRTFDEPRRQYARSIRQLSPVAYYRMPIRNKGLISDPPQYSGEVLKGEGVYTPHASGAFLGGSLRVQAGSTGRGGRVDVPPLLNTGEFTLTAVVYLETRPAGGTVATNIRGTQGNFSLALDEQGRLQGTARTNTGELRTVVSEEPLPLAKWCPVVMTADGRQLQIYMDGQLAGTTPCGVLAPSDAATLWFGTGADGIGLWDGRIDELALFDRALSGADVAALYQVALDDLAKSRKK